MRRVNEHGAKYFQPNIAISLSHGALYRLLQGLLPLAVGPETAPSLAERLLAYCETKTGTINNELFELAALVRRSAALRSIFEEQDSRDMIDRDALAAFPDFHERFQKFLRDHGHREVDFDAYVPTWIEAPWVVLDNVRLMLHMPDADTPAARERELKLRMQQAEFELFQKLPADLHYFFAELLRLVRVYTSLDDLEHYETTRLTPALRRGLRELGRQLALRGVLSDPMDIFFAHAAQIDEALHPASATIWSLFGETVRQQKQAYLRDKERKPEWVLGDADDATFAQSQNGHGLAGLPGSPGQAEGPVYVVLSADDFARFPKGAVLVARTTNPTWTPLFYRASAVVTESGGPLSHGAVTAREMRIPAVMSVKDSLRRLSNGQRVRVDGTRGTVAMV